ncbi:MAG TPA: hypothetical protein VGR87_10135 [Candidatus Limnocylindria bacterium]|jgi:hypothetical protein|nr:hypothetical protein [Candidatus Limnocylindria bacterium]
MSRMGKVARFFAASFDTLAMGGLAYTQTGGRPAATLTDFVLWGAVIAAALCALVIVLERPAELAWVAIGYVLFGGLLTDGSPHFLFILLGLALAPMVPRPRGSLALGIGIAAVSAFASRLLMTIAP